MKIRGGFNTYGQAIGILMLDARFPRPPGDMGNATTFDFPVRYHVVQGAFPARLVDERDSSLLKPFIQAARELEQAGVRAITTSCGFLALFQRQMADAVTIPVFSSILIQVPMIYQMLKRDQRVGILTASRAGLTEAHFQGVGWSSENVPIHVVGLEDTEVFFPSHRDPDGRSEVDFDLVEAEVVRAAQRLVEEAPDVGAVVLECTNLPQHAAAIQRATSRPIFDIVSLTKMVHACVVQREYIGYQ